MQKPSVHTIPDRTRIVELVAVVVTVAGKVLFMDLLNWRLPFIAVTICLWVGYLIYRSIKIKGLAAHWGFRADNLASKALQRVYIFALISIIALCVAGYFLDTLNLQWQMIYVLLLYPLWGIVQQFLLIGIVSGNLQDMKARKFNKGLIIFITSALFGLIHYPWTWLMIGTFVLAIFYGYTYLHERNLLVLGIVHGVLGAFIFYTVVARDPWLEVFGPMLENSVSIKAINITGLGLDCFGAAMMFFNTDFPSSKPQGVSDQISKGGEYLFYGRNADSRKIRNLKLGFGLLLVGFLLQAFAASLG